MSGFYVTLTSSMSLRIHGPASRQMYHFKKNEPLLIRPEDLEFFKSMPEKFQTSSSSDAEQPARRLKPLTHVSMKDVPKPGMPAKSTLQVAGEQRQKDLERNAQMRASYLEALRLRTKEPQGPVKAEDPEEVARRNADPALNAKSPQEALMMMQQMGIVGPPKVTPPQEKENPVKKVKLPKLVLRPPAGAC